MLKHINPYVPQGEFAGVDEIGLVCVRVGLQIHLLHASWVTQIGCHEVYWQLGGAGSGVRIRPMPSLAYVR